MERRTRVPNSRLVRTEQVPAETMEITAGTVFNTPAEQGCVALETPNASGNFLAKAPDGVRCNYTVAMVCGAGHPDHQRVPHDCQPA